MRTSEPPYSCKERKRERERESNLSTDEEASEDPDRPAIFPLHVHLRVVDQLEVGLLCLAISCHLR